MKALSRIYNITIPGCNERPRDKMIKLYERSEKDLTQKISLIWRYNVFEKLTKAYIIINFIAFTAAPIIFVIRFLFTGKKNLMIPFFFSWIDIETTTGFLITSLMQFGLTFVAFLGLTSHDANFFFYGCQTVLFVDFLEQKISDLQEAIKDYDEDILQLETIEGNERIDWEFLNDDSKKKISHNEIKKHLIQIIEDQREYSEYISNVCDFMRSGSFSAVAFNSIAICFWILQAFAGSYVKACAGSIIVFLQIFIPCLTGTLIAHQVSYSEIWK